MTCHKMSHGQYYMCLTDNNWSEYDEHTTDDVAG